MSTVSEEIADFSTTLSFRNLPGNVRLEAKKRLLDTLGCMIAAAKEPSVKAALNFVKQYRNPSHSSIVMNRTKTLVQYAALVNGIMGHSLEIDDTMPGVAHIGVIVIPTALAMGEWQNINGELLLTSIVLGYEVTCRIGKAALPGRLQFRGVHPTGVNGVFGASVLSSKILDLDLAKTAAAIGISGSQASGLLEATRDGTWTKRFHAGWAAHNGIISAQIAKEGFTAPRAILEGRLGFFNGIVGNSDRINQITTDLGKNYAILEPNYKPYVSGVACHPGINATLRAIEEYNIRLPEIEEIEVRMQKWGIPLVAEPIERKVRPLNTVDAEFSVYYSVAVAAYKRGPPLPEDFTEDKISNPVILRLAKKVKVIHDPELDKSTYENGELHRAGKVTIKTKDGHAYHSSASKDFYKLTQKDVEEKFKAVTNRMLTKEKTESIVRMVKNIEKLKEIGQLMSSISELEK